MKRSTILLMTILFSFGTFAQELDSLKSIMNMETDEQEVRMDEPEIEMDEEEVQMDEQEVETYEQDTFEPVIVDDGEEVNVRIMEKEIVKVIEDGDSTYVKIGNRNFLEVIEQPDSTSIRVGDKEIRIVEKDNNTNIKFHDVDKDHDRIINPKFRGHWAGFEWGINNFLDKSNTISRENEDWFLDLNTGRSWVINVNFAQYSIGFGTSHVGILTGLGLEFNNYFFDHYNSIVEQNDYVVVDSLFGTITKSKLTNTYLRVPVILEVQFPRTIRAKRIFLSAGIVAGLKLGSHTKVVYKDDSGKNKDRNKDDFNINPFRYGFTARIGFGNLSIFGDYYVTTMFIKDKGPDLHPFSLGLAMNF